MSISVRLARHAAAAGLGLAALASAAHAATTYTAVALGTFHAGFTAPNALDDEGRVVGISRVPGRGQHSHGFVTGPDGAGFIDTCPTMHECEAAAIAPDGLLVGSVFTSTGAFRNGYTEAADGSGYTQLKGLLPGASMDAVGINATHWIVGDAQPASGATAHAVTRSPKGKLTDLGSLGVSPGDWSYAAAINASLVVVGATAMPNDDSHAFVIAAPGQPMQDLGTLGGDYSDASAVNAAGVVVGNANDAAGMQWAVMHAPGTSGWVNLGSLSGLGSNARGINDHGVVVGSSVLPSGSSAGAHAFVMDTATMQMVDLNTVVTGMPARVELDFAAAINNRGQIACTGTDGKAYLLTPVATR